MLKEGSKGASTPKAGPKFIDLSGMSPSKSSPIISLKQKMGDVNKAPTPFRPILKVELGSGSPMTGSGKLGEKIGDLTPQSKASKPPLVSWLIKYKNPEPPSAKRKTRMENEEEDSEEEDEDSKEKSDQYSDADQVLVETRQSKARAKGKAKPVRIF